MQSSRLTQLMLKVLITTGPLLFVTLFVYVAPSGQTFDPIWLAVTITLCATIPITVFAYHMWWNWITANKTEQIGRGLLAQRKTKQDRKERRNRDREAQKVNEAKTERELKLAGELQEVRTQLGVYERDAARVERDRRELDLRAERMAAEAKQVAAKLDEALAKLSEARQIEAASRKAVADLATTSAECTRQRETIQRVSDQVKALEGTIRELTGAKTKLEISLAELQRQSAQLTQDLESARSAREGLKAELATVREQSRQKLADLKETRDREVEALSNQIEALQVAKHAISGQLAHFRDVEGQLRTTRQEMQELEEEVAGLHRAERESNQTHAAQLHQAREQATEFQTELASVRIELEQAKAAIPPMVKLGQRLRELCAVDKSQDASIDTMNAVWTAFTAELEADAGLKSAAQQALVTDLELQKALQAFWDRIVTWQNRLDDTTAEFDSFFDLERLVEVFCGEAFSQFNPLDRLSEWDPEVRKHVCDKLSPQMMLQLLGLYAAEPAWWGKLVTRETINQAVDDLPKATRAALCRISEGNDEFQVQFLFGGRRLRAAVLALLAIFRKEFPTDTNLLPRLMSADGLIRARQIADEEAVPDPDTGKNKFDLARSNMTHWLFVPPSHARRYAIKYIGAVVGESKVPHPPVEASSFDELGFWAELALLFIPLSVDTWSKCQLDNGDPFLLQELSSLRRFREGKEAKIKVAPHGDPYRSLPLTWAKARHNAPALRKRLKENTQALCDLLNQAGCN